MVWFTFHLVKRKIVLVFLQSKSVNERSKCRRITYLAVVYEDYVHLFALHFIINN